MKLLSATLLATTLCVNVSFAQTKGFNKANIDNTCKPCDDFYQYINGGWIKNNPIPAAYSSWGNFHILSDKNNGYLKAILEDLQSKQNIAGSNEQKLSDYYYTALDTVKLNKDGYAPIKKYLDEIAKINDAASAQAFITTLHKAQISFPFAIYIMPDAKNSKVNIANLYQSGLSLPEKDYYLKTDAASQDIQKEYKKYVAKLFELTGSNKEQAAKSAEDVYAYEYKLATFSKGNVELRDPNASYNIYTLEQLNALAKYFNWKNYFNSIGAANITKINVGQVDFIRQSDSLMAKTSTELMKTMLKWTIISSAAPYLSMPFVEAEFNFNKKTLKGSKEQLPRWKTAVASTDGSLGDALGQIYVKTHFTPEAKKKMTELIANLKSALKVDITTLPGMSDSTKVRATGKLNAFVDKIGYPEKWKDYSSIKITRDSYFENVLSAKRYEFTKNVEKENKAVDPKEWGLTPPTVNAYYNPLMNEIVFPAGILQPPFFDPNADDAYNYGGIGGVIGHEMTHGFDDQGAQFDADGNLKMWWTETDYKNFTEKAQCIIEQFNSIKAVDTLRFNGELVVGESIADLGGLTIAYKAYKTSLKGKEAPVIDGFTGEQRFFIGWAQGWASNEREKFQRMMLMTNPHPLSKYRVNAPVSNMVEFQKAFGCKEGDKMVRPAKDKCIIW